MPPDPMSSPADRMALSPGDRIAHWEVTRFLGRGGMGEVYLVRHFRIKETVLALKVLSPKWMEHSHVRGRFHREGAVMARFEHEHIVRVFSAGAEHEKSRNLDYILMEYIQGRTLDKVLQEQRWGEPLDFHAVLEFSYHVANALAYAHKQNPPVVHRDVKPSNIMIADPTSDYPVGRAVVMDWGIAKELTDADEIPLTEVWTVVGTPQYCAPEQMRPFDQVQASADIYSLGMVIYEMCTGRQFFAGLDKKSVIRKVCDEAEENEPHFNRPTDVRFHALVRKAIAKSRARRYQRVEDFLQDLENCRAAVRGPVMTTSTLTSGKPDEFRKPKNSPQAGEVYAKTRGSIADAHELAYETLREETDSEQAQGVVARGEGTEDSGAAALPQAVRGEGEYTAAQANSAEAVSLFAADPQPESPRRRGSFFRLFSWVYLLPGSVLFVAILYLLNPSGDQKNTADSKAASSLQVVNEPKPFVQPLPGEAARPVLMPFEPSEEQREVAVPQPQAPVKAVPVSEPPQAKFPHITWAKPDPQGELTVAEGQGLGFAIEAESGGGRSPRYIWFLNGKKQAEGKSWTYRPGFDEGGGKPKEVKVEVVGEANLKDEKTWQVQVQNVDRPPVITVALPRTSSVEITSGDDAEFSVTATDPDQDDRLVYVWSVNGQEVSRGERRQFHAPSAATSYQVTAEVFDKEGQKDRRAWNVTVKTPSPLPRLTQHRLQDEQVSPNSTQPPPLAAVAVPLLSEKEVKAWLETCRQVWEEKKVDVLVQPGELMPLSEAEVRAWLETYRQAWEEKKMDVLVQIDEISPQDTPRLKRILDGYKNFRVVLKDVVVHSEGNVATVRFTRVDTVDGRVLSHPPMDLTIEKGASGDLRRK